MNCSDCKKAGTCLRRGTALAIPRLYELCARDPRYAVMLDDQHGVTDESVVPSCLIDAPESAPSLARMGTNAAKAGFRAARSRFRTASAAVQAERKSVCEACNHFDAEQRRCRHEDCGCFVDAKVKVASEACPIGKWSAEPRKGRRRRSGRCRSCARPHKGFSPLAAELPPLAETPTRHLIYHLWPVAGNGWWQWNVEQLLRRIDQFDGVRAVAILTPAKKDPPLDSVEAVQRAFGDERIDHWIVRPNDSRKREVVTHEALLKQLPRGDQHITFSGHAKGVRNGPIATCQGTIRRWCEIMYAACLDDPAAVDAALNSHWFAGSLRRFNRMSRGGWHYSGTYYWFRNHEALLNRGLVSNRWWGTESWPGDVCSREQAFCLFGDGIGDLYNETIFETVWQEWEQFNDGRTRRLP